MDISDLRIFTKDRERTPVGVGGGGGGGGGGGLTYTNDGGTRRTF